MTRIEDKPEYDLEDEDDLRIAFNSYNPEEDPSGNIGIGLAEAALKRFGYDQKKVQEWANATRKRILFSDKPGLERTCEETSINSKTQRDKAFASGDYINFVRLCEESGYNPDGKAEREAYSQGVFLIGMENIRR